MLVLPSALSALAQYPQFICYYVGDDTNNPGKLIKMPLDYRTGRVANAHDSNVWTDFETASRVGHRNGHGVGFVLTRDDPFFFIDIDSCYDEQTQQWAPTAQRLLAACAGAAVEVSSSGRGLHIIGKGQAPAHRCKNEIDDTKIEMYTEARFIALTGTNMIGNAETDLTDRLPSIVDQFFPLPHGAENGVTEWTTSPRAGWCGPTDNNELIALAIKSRSARSIFGTGATFADLWYVDATALSKAFPANNAADPYDASSADAALAQHLAFWTGCNCERIKTLMLQSALVRPKWERESYINTTIQKACARQTEVFKGSKSTSPIPHSPELQPTSTIASTLWHEVSIADVLTNPPPFPHFFIESLLPAGVLTLLGAHGGTGKTMLALQAAVCLATGERFVGKDTQRSRVLFFSGEDAVSIIRHRLARICSYMRIDPATLLTNLKVIDATSNPCLYTAIGNHSEPAATTAGYHELKRMAAAFCADVIIIDNASDTFDANENERARVRQFVRQLVQLGETQHAAILLLAHIDKQTAKVGSSEGYSGSTAWHNSARSRLFLTNKEESLVLEHQKSNFGRCAEPMCLRWTESGMLEHVAAPSEQDAKNRVLGLIQEYYERGDFISPATTSPNNAYRMLYSDPEFPRALDRGKLTTILREAENGGQLKREEYTKDGKPRTRYKVTPTSPTNLA